MAEIGRIKSSYFSPNGDLLRCSKAIDLVDERLPNPLLATSRSVDFVSDVTAGVRSSQTVSERETLGDIRSMLA